MGGGCFLYGYQNTGTTTQYITGTTCDNSCSLIAPIPSGTTYWGNFEELSVTTDPDILEVLLTGTTPDTRYLSFSSVCGSDTFYFRARPDTILSVPFIVGEFYCFNDVLICGEPNTNINGCFELVSSLGVPPSSPYVGDVFFEMPLNYSGASSEDCLTECPCETFPCETNYCINDTGTNVDGNYTYVGDYSGYPYWSGDTTPIHYIFFNGYEWCLSDSLGGECILFGAYPCLSVCPDICEHYLDTGICPTPTPTPTINCDVLDFEAIFDCEYTPTPTPTPTISLTPTITPTPSSTQVCGYFDIDVSLSAYTPTPTPTPTTTPTQTPTIERPYNFSGDVTFNTINGDIICPNSLKFQDCYNGALYYTTNPLTIPGGVLEEFMIFSASVDNTIACISYLGIDDKVIGANKIELLSEPIGFSNLGQCVNCVQLITQTPTQTPTMTPTPTPSSTSTPIEQCECYTFTCNQLSENPEAYCSVWYTPCGESTEINQSMTLNTSLTVCVEPNTTPTGWPTSGNPLVQLVITDNGPCNNGLCVL